MEARHKIAMKTTRIEYLYRDAGNNKVYSEAEIDGSFSLKELRLRCFDGLYFVASEWNIPDLREHFWEEYGYDADLDHDWHELISIC